MKRKTKYGCVIAATLMSTVLLFGCSDDTARELVTVANGITQSEAESLSTIGKEDIRSVISKMVTYTDEDYYSEWKNESPTYLKLNGTSAAIEGNGAAIVDNSTVTIKTAGVYVLSGQLDDGQIIVDIENKGTVKLVLNGVEISSSNNAPIYVKKADKTVLSLVEGTENILSDGNQYDIGEEEPNSAIFSKGDLTINGTGSLTVHGNYNNGITSKDTLRIIDGNIHIIAVDDAIIGRDILAVKEGNLTIEASGDGMRATNDKDAGQGNVVVEGGTFEITAANDGIQAESSILIADGDFSIATGGGAPEAISVKVEGRPGAATTTTTTSTDIASAKGIKAAVEIAIGGGTFNVNSADDSIHSNKSITINGGSITLASGDDGIHADSAILTNGGDINIVKSYEGMESKVITIADGNIHVIAGDDGINIGGGNDGSGMDMNTAAEESVLSINGGYVYVNSSGDGLDSNSSIIMTGGTVVVSGPTGNGNGALDYDQSFNISGGLLIVAGSAGMAQATSEGSSQNGLLMTFSQTQSANTLVHLEDSKGNTVAAFAPEKDFQTVVISSPDLDKDSSYTLFTNGEATGSVADGFYKNAEVQNGTKIVDFTISDTVTWLDENGVTTAKTPGPGGMGMGGQGAPGGGHGGDMFANLDEDTRAKAQTIMEKQRKGEITMEEAQSQLEELGVTFPGKAMKP